MGKFTHLKGSDLEVARTWSIRSGMNPIKKVAQILKRHLSNLLTYFEHPISNGVAKSLNSKIQGIKSRERSFWSFEGFRNGIFFSMESWI
ncbi:transposase [Microbulbifer epialgicus]|uniref:Transposase n=1 Tax=Microbulbifer epialgicus TaxID=393907 RepID=A0ABV4P836_9GAMM